MFLFWAVAGVLAAAAAGLILMRAARAATSTAGPRIGGAITDDDTASVLYRRQLAEIDELAERGLIGEGERKGAHAEAARRLLAAADAPAEAWASEDGAARNHRLGVLAGVVAAPALALGLYLALGAPGMADQPYAARLKAWREGDLMRLTPPEAAAVLRQVTGERPDDAEGFRLLGMVEGAAQNPLAAVRALRRAAELAPRRPEVWQMLGEAEIVAAGGKVDANAEASFRRLLALEPGNPGARFFLAQAAADAGRPDEAVTALRALLADMDGDDPRRGAVEESIARIQGRASAPAGDPREMSMIRGMVDGLAARLKSDPDDPEGWVRLVRAYAVLGETANRDRAYAAARARYAGRADIVSQLDQAARVEPMR
ncbi:c-type cytochrome biogenesis protein CcmI [Phenylobacterium sp.]|uniref:c-type cytochrome biogenesis protein CcmI n=1 Tax=Phenylobacterium sp. TaxID=1871053 RepID=UPI00301C70C3